MTGEYERLRLRHRHAKMAVCDGCREGWPCPTWLLLDAHKEAVETLRWAKHAFETWDEDEPPPEGNTSLTLVSKVNAILARAREQGVIQ